MKKSLTYLRTLKASIEVAVTRLHSECFGYPPDRVECTCLDSFDLMLNIERQRSPTESFLLKNDQSQLAKDVGLSINNIVKDRVSELLVEDFELPVAEVSFFQPTLPKKFSLFVVLDQGTDKK